MQVKGVWYFVPGSNYPTKLQFSFVSSEHCVLVVEILLLRYCFSIAQQQIAISSSRT